LGLRLKYTRNERERVKEGRGWPGEEEEEVRRAILKIKMRTDRADREEQTHTISANWQQEEGWELVGRLGDLAGWRGGRGGRGSIISKRKLAALTFHVQSSE
jgi:hypothetical protein